MRNGIDKALGDDNDDPRHRISLSLQLLVLTRWLNDELYSVRAVSVLDLWESGNLTYREIADYMGVSKSLVQIMIREARDRRNHDG